MLRPGAIGDTVLTVPALLALRRAFPRWNIEVAGNAAALPLALAAGVADSWWSFDDPRVTRLFVPGQPAPHDSFVGLTAAVAWCADPDGILRAGLAARGATTVIVARSQPPADAPEHVALYLLRTLAPLLREAGVAAPQADILDAAAPDPVVLDPAILESCDLANSDPGTLALPPVLPPIWASEQADVVLRGTGLAGQPFVVVQPGSGSRAKNWPPERFVAVIQALRWQAGIQTLVLGGPADAEALRLLRDLAPGPLSMLTNVPLLVVAAILLRARAYLGNDSGLAHLAGQLGLPTLALFGPTDPVRWRPLGPRVHILRSLPLSALAVEPVLSALLPLVAAND